MQTANVTLPATTAAQKQKAADQLSVTKRLKSELMSLMRSPVPGVTAFPESDNLLNWVGTIEGPNGTPFEGLKYKLSLKFPSNYPYSAPTIKFETGCFHPNVDQEGNICLDILKDKWSAGYSVQTVLISLQSLLGEPNNDSPLNTEAAELWGNQKPYRVRVQQFHDNSK
ncbi:ubiquitin-conjugating enzyme E2 C [Cladochytrium replicatum]|nr:ubiquitin-conjugating enzyme E2 C [Cladochytrium replicatum]